MHRYVRRPRRRGLGVKHTARASHPLGVKIKQAMQFAIPRPEFVTFAKARRRRFQRPEKLQGLGAEGGPALARVPPIAENRRPDVLAFSSTAANLFGDAKEKRL